MANKHANLKTLFTDIADTIRDKTGSIGTIPVAEFSSIIRNNLEMGPYYLTFRSPNSFTLKVGNAKKHWNGTLEYSTNASSWSIWDGTTTLSSATNGGNNVLYLRGTGNTVITGNMLTYGWVLTGADIACIGNIENLLDYATVKAGGHPTMASNCYAWLFSGCSALTYAPALPAPTLTHGCYHGMFSQCTSLTLPPALPATTLAANCYDSMFYKCTSLDVPPPILPATELADYCYQYMFESCRFSSTPILPATTLARGCYQGMFCYCDCLDELSSGLPVTTLADSCYRSMFEGCTWLDQLPSLPATTLADNCYQYMFNGCTKLKLSSTKTGEYTSYYKLPSSGTGTTATNSLNDMFTSTGGTFKGTPTFNTTYYVPTNIEIV